MHLLFTQTAYPPSMGGAQLHQHLLAQTLLMSHDIQVVSKWNNNRTDWLLGTTLCAPSQGQDYSINGVNVHCIGLSVRDKICLIPSVLLYYPFMKAALPSIVACLDAHLQAFGDKADLIHNVRIGREGLSYASMQVARKKGIPFVLTPIHHPRWVGWRYREYIKLYTMADAVLALTNVEKLTLISLGVRENRITVSGTGPILASQAYPENFTSGYGIKGPMVLFIGQHYAYKGYKELLKAMPFVWRKVPEAEFVFIGPAIGDSEEEFTANPDKRIHRLGNVDLQTKTDALAACALLCLPSTQESFGIVYTEAWSFGKPVIGCNIPAVAEVINEGLDGFLVAQEPAPIAESILDLLLNPGLAANLGTAGKRKVAERYTWKQVAARTEHAYKSIEN
jgi:glycosyltransferase involved in cell wall biosynthesis